MKKLRQIIKNIQNDRTQSILATIILILVIICLVIGIATCTAKRGGALAYDVESGLMVEEADITQSGGVLIITGTISNEGKAPMPATITITIDGSSGKWTGSDSTDNIAIPPKSTWQFGISKFSQDGKENQAIQYADDIRIENVVVDGNTNSNTSTQPETNNDKPTETTTNNINTTTNETSNEETTSNNTSLDNWVF